MIEAGAIVDPRAKIHRTAIIRTGAIIGPNVTIGAGVHVGHYSTIGMWAEYRGRVDERRDEPDRHHPPPLTSSLQSPVMASAIPASRRK